jgi:hypothetical protein
VRQVIFVCHTCFHTNRQELGVKGFEPLTYKMESLTEAFTHVREGHEVYTEYGDEID